MVAQAYLDSTALASDLRDLIQSFSLDNEDTRFQNKLSRRKGTKHPQHQFVVDNIPHVFDHGSTVIFFSRIHRVYLSVLIDEESAELIRGFFSRRPMVFRLVFLNPNDYANPN